MRKFFAFLFCISLVFPLILATQISVSVATWALDRNFYIDALDQPYVYQTLTSGQMTEMLLQEQFGLSVGANTEELESVLSNILTPDYLHDQVSNFINDLFDHLQGKTDEFAPTLDISPLKSALSGNQQDEFLNTLIAALPICSTGQTPGFGDGDQNACKPANISDELLIEQVLKPALPGILSQIPDEISVEDNIIDFYDSNNWRGFIPGMAIPASIILGIMALVFFTACIWYITAMIADSQWRVRLQWLGWMLFIPSILIFLLGIATQSGIPAYWIRFGLERANLSSTPFGPGLADTLQAVSVSALPRVAAAFQMVGGICGALSFTLIFWGIATPRKKVEEIQ